MNTTHRNVHDIRFAIAAPTPYRRCLKLDALLRSGTTSPRLSCFSLNRLPASDIPATSRQRTVFVLPKKNIACLRKHSLFSWIDFTDDVVLIQKDMTDIDFVHLDLMEFHDLPVEKFSLTAGDHSAVELILLPYDEDDKSYKRSIVHISRFLELSMTATGQLVLHDLEVNSFEFTLQEEGLYGTIVLISGFPTQSITIKFAAQQIKVSGWPVN